MFPWLIRDFLSVSVGSCVFLISSSIFIESFPITFFDFIAIISQLQSMSKGGVKKVFAVGFSNGGYWAAALAARGDIDAGVSYYGEYSEGGRFRG